MPIAARSGATEPWPTRVAALYRKHFIKPNLEQALSKNFQTGAELLHAGCASGQVDVGLHERFTIMAMDISIEALGPYGSNNPAARRIEQADIFSLPIEPDSLDGVFNPGVMEHFDETPIQALLTEFRRVIKPVGSQRERSECSG